MMNGPQHLRDISMLLSNVSNMNESCFTLEWRLYYFERRRYCQTKLFYEVRKCPFANTLIYNRVLRLSDMIDLIALRALSLKSISYIAHFNSAH